MRTAKRSIVLFVALTLVVTFSISLLAQEEEVEMTDYMESRLLTIPEDAPTLEEPFVVTTCGQSPGSLLFKVSADQVGVNGKRKDRLKPEGLVDEDGNPKYETLVVTTGTSRKGMGAAGIDISDEVDRSLALIEKAKELGMPIFAVQMEGPSRRTDSNDEKSIKNVTPKADLLVTRYDVNWDGYFTKAAKENDIPQIFIEAKGQVSEILPELFGKQESEEESG